MSQATHEKVIQVCYSDLYGFETVEVFDCDKHGMFINGEDEPEFENLMREYALMGYPLRQKLIKKSLNTERNAKT